MLDRPLRVVRRYGRLKKRYVAFASVALAVVVLVAGTATLRRVSAPNVLTQNPARHWSWTRSTILKVNEVYNFGIWLGNTSHETTATLDSVTFPRGIPAHVHLYAVSLTPANYLSGEDWPPENRGLPPPVPPQFVVGGQLYPVAGYRLAAGMYRTVIVSAIADAPGAYVLGPVTVHAKVPGVLDTVLGEVPIEETYTQYGVLCPGVSGDTCHAAINKALQSS